jgi:spore coat protein A
MTSSRRQFLAILGAVGATQLFEHGLFVQSDDIRPNTLVGVRLAPFVDPLFLPPTLSPQSPLTGSQYYKVTLSEFRQKLHRDLPASVLWGFNGIAPGPIIAARKDQAVTIDWHNQLPPKHRLLVDHTLDGAGPSVPEVRSTIHLHGGHVSADSDGYPEDWIIPGQTQEDALPQSATRRDAVVSRSRDGHHQA